MNGRAARRIRWAAHAHAEQLRLTWKASYKQLKREYKQLPYHRRVEPMRTMHIKVWSHRMRARHRYQPRGPYKGKATRIYPDNVVDAVINYGTVAVSGSPPITKEEVINDRQAMKDMEAKAAEDRLEPWEIALRRTQKLMRDRGK